MDYQKECAEKRKALRLAFLKKIIKKIFFIIFAVLITITTFMTFFFVRDVIFGQSTLSEFKKNYYGIPAQRLMDVNNQLRSRGRDLKEWFDNLTKRITS